MPANHESSSAEPQFGRYYREGPSQHSLLNLPNHACLWGNAISFSLVKPAYSRCWMNLLKLLASSDRQATLYITNLALSTLGSKQILMVR